MVKKLFLSSYFTKVSNLLLPFIQRQPKDCNLTFIPTAADPYTEKPWVYEDRNKLIEMGFNVVDTDLKNKTREQLYKELEETDIIFVSGGNIYYLLEKVKNSGFDEVVTHLIAKGIIYIGSSAGSVLMCPTIEHIEDLDDKTKANLSSFAGIEVIDFLILPHYGEPKYEERFQRIINKWIKRQYRIQTLSNSQVIVVKDDEMKIVSV